MPRGDPSRKRCAIYTRKSSEEGLEQEFNSLTAQREACEAYTCRSARRGWVLAKTRYDDGGLSGGNRVRRIELLRHRHERRTLCIEDLDQPGKISERPRQPVDLVDDDGIDPAGPDIGKQALQGRPLQVAT